jgi:hypothetical protein
MKKLWKATLPLLLIVIIAAISACNLTDEEVTAVVGTVENLSASEIVGLAETVEALSPQQQIFLEQAAMNAGLPTLSPDQIKEIDTTVAMARMTATAQGYYVPSGPAATTIASGERVNATEAPNIAPIIIYFFASAPNEAQAKDGIRYFLNWTTENANRVEIFGTVMENPIQGSWAVYNESNNWVLWAANDQVWVESNILVQPDQNTGAVLQPVTVNARSILLTLRDPQFVDGDAVSVDVNGVRVISDFALGGRHVSFPVTLQSGQNTVSIEARSVGVTPPMVGEITVGNVTSGPATQLTGGLNAGQRQDFIITAP